MLWFPVCSGICYNENKQPVNHVKLRNWYQNESAINRTEENHYVDVNTGRIIQYSGNNLDILVISAADEQK